MKGLVAGALILAFATVAMAKGAGFGTGSNSSSHSVKPYVTGTGKFVPGHRQTNPNKTQRDNFNAQGNFNPYNGKTGTRSPSY
jgi:hypothetical protein